ncbi:MAG: DUF4261 domain-containing protein [Planctomycetota bacterium]
MTMVCFVVFSDQASFDPYKFQEAIRGRLLDGIELDSIEGKSESIYQIDLSGSCDEGKAPGAVFVSEMPRLETGSDEEAGPLWPDAPQQLSNHQSHWIVTTATCECSPANEAMLLTQVVDAILKTHPTATGVLWHQHGLKVSSENFQNVVAAMQPGDLPVALWIDITVVPGENAPVIALTTGMDSFGLMEIENIGSPESPEELYARIMGVCEYLLHNGPILNHGDTLGESDTERIKVLHADSAFGREGKVIHLRYDGGGGSATTLQGPSQPSAFKTLAVLLACLSVIGLLITGTVMGVTWAVASLRPDPEPAAAPWAVQENNEEPGDGNALPGRDEGNDGVQQTPVNGQAPSTVKPEPQGIRDAALEPEIPVIESPSINEDGPESKTNADDSTKSASVENPFLIDPDAGQDPFEVVEPSPPKTIVEPEDSVQSSDSPFQVDPTPNETTSEELSEDSENPFQVDETPGQSTEQSTERASNRNAPKVGDKVRVEWGNRWWDGQIIAVDGEKYRFSYDGWSDNWDEWKTIDQLRWPDDTPIKKTP